MLRKSTRASQLVFLLLLAALLTCASNIQSASASGTIYIRADGSIDPPTAPIHRSIDMYTFTSDIDGSIIVEKDNILLDGAGHTLQGTGVETGIDLSERTNVTIKNVAIKTFDYAVYLSSSNNVTISGTNVADSSDGIWISNSFSNSISGNNITANVLEGIYILASSANSISGNDITANTFDGVYLFSSSNNSISGNNITDNGYGITSYYSSNNRIFSNNFISNFEQAYSESSIDIWDNAYPLGGNYWNDYAEPDLNRGSDQNETGSDGIGDAPYVIDESNIDHYPLMKPYGGPHDVGITNVTTSKTIVCQAFAMNLSVKVLNYGEQEEVFNMAIKANSTVIETRAITLGVRASSTMVFKWNTSGFVKGNYTISADASPVLGETATEDNSLADGWIMIAMVGDITGPNGWPEGKCNVRDVALVARLYGARYPDANYDPNCDIVYDGKIDVRDVSLVAMNYGKIDQ